MCAGDPGRENGRGGRLDSDHLDVGLSGLEVFSDARDRSACAHSRNKEVHLSVRVLIDFGAGRLKVNSGICRIDKLPGNQAVRDLSCKLLGSCNGALHALCALGQNQLGAIGAHELTPLDGHGFRHDEQDPVAARSGH